MEGRSGGGGRAVCGRKRQWRKKRGKGGNRDVRVRVREGGKRAGAGEVGGVGVGEDLRRGRRRRERGRRSNRKKRWRSTILTLFLETTNPLYSAVAMAASKGGKDSKGG